MTHPDVYGTNMFDGLAKSPSYLTKKDARALSLSIFSWKAMFIFVFRPED